MEEKGLEKKEEMLPEERSHYDSFVEEVATRKLQAKRGDTVGRHAKIWVTKPDSSEYEVALYAVGDSDVVQEIGDALERKYEYKGFSPQRLSPEREAEVAGEEMGKLIKDTAERAPHIMPRVVEKLRGFEEKLKLPPLGSSIAREVEGIHEAVEGALELNETLKPFKPKFEREGGEKHALDG